jgi:hypothetical protein
MVNDRLLAHADILVGIFWSRVGTPTGEAASGTIEEIERHIAEGKPAMLYFSSRDIPQDMIDGEQLEKLTAFKKWASQQGIYYEYETPDDLRSALREHLPRAMIENAYVSAMLKPVPDTGRPPSFVGVIEPQRRNGILEPDAQRMLKNAASDGYVRISHYIGGTDVAAGAVNFTEHANGRIIARWKAVVDQLAGRGLIEDTTGAGQIFAVTDAGYKAADALSDGFLGP